MKQNEHFLHRGKGDGALSLFEEKVVVHCRRLFRYVYSKCRDEDLSYDIVQETMIVAQRQFDRGLYSERGLVWGWLAKIASNQLIGYYRTRKRHLDVESDKRQRICENLGWNDHRLSEPEIHGMSVDTRLDFVEQETQKQKVERLIPMLLNSGFAILNLSSQDLFILRERHLEMKVFKEIAETVDMPLSTLMSRYYSLMKKVRRQLLEFEGNDGTHHRSGTSSDELSPGPSVAFTDVSDIGMTVSDKQKVRSGTHEVGENDPVPV